MEGIDLLEEDARGGNVAKPGGDDWAEVAVEEGDLGVGVETAVDGEAELAEESGPYCAFDCGPSGVMGVVVGEGVPEAGHVVDVAPFGSDGVGCLGC